MPNKSLKFNHSEDRKMMYNEMLSKCQWVKGRKCSKRHLVIGVGQ